MQPALCSSWMADSHCRDYRARPTLRKERMDKSPRKAEQAVAVSKNNPAANASFLAIAMGVCGFLGNSGMDSRCVHVLHSYLCRRRAGRKLPCCQGRHYLEHHPHAGHAAHRRSYSRLHGRSLRPPPSPDRLRSLLLHLHGAHALCAKLHRRSFSIARSMASAWEGTGASALHWSWRVRLRAGAACSPESCRPATRLGYLLAAVAIRTIEPRFGWKWMFLAGLFIAGLVALLTVLSPGAGWRGRRTRAASFAANPAHALAVQEGLLPILSC